MYIQYMFYHKSCQHLNFLSRLRQCLLVMKKKCSFINDTLQLLPYLPCLLQQSSTVIFIILNNMIFHNNYTYSTYVCMSLFSTLKLMKFNYIQLYSNMLLDLLFLYSLYEYLPLHSLKR